MFKIYLLILLIVSIINGCTSVKYSREHEIAPPAVVERTRPAPGTPGSESIYQPKVITTAVATQTTPVAVASRVPEAPASRSAVLELLKQSKSAMDKGHYNEANSLLKRALRIEPGNAWLWHNMAVIQFYREDYQQAIQQALKSNNLAKNNQKLTNSNYQVIKQSYIELGEPKKAARY